MSDKETGSIDVGRLSGATQEYLDMKNEVLGSVNGKMDKLFITDGEEQLLQEIFPNSKK